MLMQAVSGQESNISTLRFLFLNADRLYDNVDDQGTADNEFSPAGSLAWDKSKYEKRCEDIAGILSSQENGILPGLIALSGIENEHVATDIFSSRKLRKAGYSILAGSFYPGSGIVIAAADGAAEILEHRSLVPDLNPQLTDISVIQYSKVKLSDGLIYHIFLNEWPDRQAAGSQAESMRMACAATLRKEVDLIINFERDARIIIAGSFFDEPTDRSVMNILNATNKQKNISERDLYNLHFDKHNFEGRGTVTVNGIWQMTDFIIVSPSLLKENSFFSTSFEGGFIGEPSPSFGPAFSGSIYTGGSGAHLPVFIDLSMNEKR